MGNYLSRLQGRRNGDRKTRTPENTTHIHREEDTESQQQRSPTRGSVNIPIRGSGSNNTTPRTSQDFTVGSIDGILNSLEDESLHNDADLANFDDGMKQHTVKVLDSLEQGLKSGGLEMSSLKDVTTGLMEMDKDVMDFVSNFDLDIWKSDEMRDLVTQYFQHSKEALEFCTVLQRSVQHARDNQMIIESAIGYMPDSREPNEDECRKILHELDLFVHAEDPFSTEFAKFYDQVYGHQEQLHVRLDGRKDRIRRRERNFRMLRKVTNVILTATCASLVVCAAVAMAVAAPLIPGRSISATAALPFQTYHGWLKNLWSKYEQRITVEKDIIDRSSLGTWVAIKDLDTINSMVNNLKTEMRGIVRNIEFGHVRGDSLAVQQSVKMIKRKQESFVQQLDDLSSYVSYCVRRINTQRTRVLDIILGHAGRA